MARATAGAVVRVAAPAGNNKKWGWSRQYLLHPHFILKCRNPEFQGEYPKSNEDSRLPSLNKSPCYQRGKLHSQLRLAAFFFSEKFKKTSI
jgi:hypothetical protein